MAYLAPNEETVVCVGGLTTQAGASNDNGGGATKAAWDAGSPSDFMTATGGPIKSDTGCTYDHTGGAAERMISKAGIGTDVVVGTLVRVTGTNIDTGIYEVTSVAGDDSWIACANLQGDFLDDNTNTTVDIGGALATLDYALADGVNNHWLYDRNIYYNAAETITAAIGVDTFTGQNNTRVRVVGTNASLVVDGTRPVITASGTLADGMLNFQSTCDFTTWQFIDFNAASAFDFCVNNPAGQTASNYHVFHDCIFRGAVSQGVHCESGQWSIFQCQFYDNVIGLHTEGAYMRITGCSIHDNTSYGLYISGTYLTLMQCLIYDNGDSGILGDGHIDNALIMHNTFYANDGDGIEVSSSGGINCLIANNSSTKNGGYGYSFISVASLRFFAFNHSCDGVSAFYDNVSGHCNLLDTPTDDAEFQDFADGNNVTGSPAFGDITDGAENFTPTAVITAAAMDAGTD